MLPPDSGSSATAYRYRDEIVTVLSAQAPDLHGPCSGSPTRAGRRSSWTGSLSPDRAPRPPPAPREDDRFLVLGHASGEGRPAQRPAGGPAVSRVKAPVSRPRSDRRDRGHASAAVTETTDERAELRVRQAPFRLPVRECRNHDRAVDEVREHQAKAVPNTARAVDSSSTGSPTRRGRRERPSRGLSMIDLCRGWAVSGGATDRATPPAPVDCVSRRHAAVCPGPLTLTCSGDAHPGGGGHRAGRLGASDIASSPNEMRPYGNEAVRVPG